MRDTLSSKLYDREVSGPGVRYKHYRRLYGDRQMIAELDIVNELEGHSGCVNALSWSKSGHLLASGSDDQHLNIHRYQPPDENSQFKLTTTVATGHTQNIFSVKFMPHHDDRTVITAAGDGEVRVFDLEYAGQAREASNSASMASEGRRRIRGHVYSGVRYLSDGDTDCRVYRSHADRVKRIVTESSPYLFLTCSEDGEVRQWDLRQPSSAYPLPRAAARYGTSTDTSVPPPLISYKRYQLDLNTISCSPSQPHYIALGGAHLHAFLHDRRMTGRDRLHEAGKPTSPSAHRTSEDEELMRQATQCVRKFAPKGQRKMKRTENGHITACKISDARPDEMVVSWSGDHVYSFDLVRSPDVDEEEVLAPLQSSAGNRAKESRDRKRKRKQNSSDTSLGQDATARASSRPRTVSSGPDGEDEGARLRVRYQNGQSEDIRLPVKTQHRENIHQVLTAQEREAQRIARATVNIRSSLFGSDEPGRHPSWRFTQALGQAASILPDIDEAMRDWRYPMNPSVEMVVREQTLRRNRESARRFVQAAGTLARVLGGKLQTPSGSSPMITQFTSIEARSNDLELSSREQFAYDFLKAILLWLESGVGKLIEGFTRPREMLPNVKAATRLPIPEDQASTEAIDDILVPYLLQLASDKPVVNVETNRFEVDENRQLFSSEKTVVLAFAAAVRIPFADLSSAVILAEGHDRMQAQDRQVAHRYWGLKVARGVLLNAAEGVDFGFVGRAFGGSGRVIMGLSPDDQDADLENAPDDEDKPVRNVTLLDEDGRTMDGANADDVAEMNEVIREARKAEASFATDEEMADVTESENLLREPMEGQARQAFVETVGDDDDHDANDDDEENEDENDSDEEDADDDEDEEAEPDEEDGVPNPGLPHLRYASAFERRRMREKVEVDVPCSPYTRVYRGHCNVKTVKDVNYFGPNDEYVISGSDDGNFFIWDRKSGELVNLLEGDGEVVNVVQGHPYECCLAVSGIDHTIKIFSPDARAREAARLGQGIMAHDASSFSSIAWPPRLGRRQVARRRQAEAQTEGQAGDVTENPSTTTTSEPAMPRSNSDSLADDDDDEYVAENGLRSRKQMHDAHRIINQNDVERQGGNQDAYITLPHSQLLQLLFGNLGNVVTFADFD